MTFDDFTAKHPAVKIDAKQVDTRPDGVDDWIEGTAHWQVTLYGPHGQHTLFYSMGPGHRRYKKSLGYADRSTLGYPRVLPYKAGDPAYKPHRCSIMQAEAWEACTEPTPPTLPDVLESLSMDWSSIENSTAFEDWAADLGFDTDSRKAERAYRATQESALRCRQALGWEAYNDALSIEW